MKLRINFEISQRNFEKNKSVSLFSIKNLIFCVGVSIESMIIPTFAKILSFNVLRLFSKQPHKKHVIFIFYLLCTSRAKPASSHFKLFQDTQPNSDSKVEATTKQSSQCTSPFFNIDNVKKLNIFITKWIRIS